MNAEELISKKEVLELTEISYGQFYRWKRKGLIPESWFIRKSTFTGQETFLPRAKILERIEKIKSLKDEHSLEELAEVLAPEVSDRRYAAEEVERMAWISPQVREFYAELRPVEAGYTFADLLFLTVIERMSQKLEEEEIALVASTLLEHQQRLQSEGDFRWTVAVARKPFERSLAKLSRKFSLSFCTLHSGPCAFDPLTEIAVNVDLHPMLEELRLKLGGLRE